jgi:hypothetical protein
LPLKHPPRPGERPFLELLETRTLPSLGPAVAYTVPGVAGPVVTGDFNGDGRADIAVLGDSAVNVFLSNSDGTFQSPVSSPGASVFTSSPAAVADFNGDGKLDLAVSSPISSGLQVLLGNGNGTFQAPMNIPLADPGDLAVGDFNGDGKADLVALGVAGFGGIGVYEFLGNGDGTFRAPTLLFTQNLPDTLQGVAVGDVNGDGRPDIVTTSPSAQYTGHAGLLVFLGNGDGTFQAPRDSSPGTGLSDLILADVNGDGKPDVAARGTSFPSHNYLLLGNGDGTFQAPVNLSSSLTGAIPKAVADFNGDGKPDLLYRGPGDYSYGIPSSAVVLLGNGNGTFQAPIGFPDGKNYGGTAVGDFNGDGKPDVAATGGYHGTVSVLLNQDLPRPTLLTSGGAVQGFDPAGKLLFAFDPYLPGTAADTRVATGDVNGDGVPDLITAPGPGTDPLVRVFDGVTGWPVAGPLGSFEAYDPVFTGGVYVASGDLDRDGDTDIVTGADAGGGPHVKVFDGTTGAVMQYPDHPELVNGFYAYDPIFSGGVRVAVGDVNGDGQPDLITGAGPGGGPHVRVFDGATLNEIPLNGTPAFAHGFYAFDPNFHGGVYVATADLNGDGKADIVVGGGITGPPEVRVFSGADGSILADLMAYAAGFTGGVRVGTADVNGDGVPDILTGAGPGGGPEVRVFDGTTLAVLEDFFAYDPSYTGGVYVGGG